MEPHDVADEAAIIQRTMAEAGLEADAVLAALVGLLVRDHLASRAKANAGTGTTAINHPTTLWLVEKMIAERLMANSKQGKAHDPLLGTLSVMLVHCRERAEDKADPRKGGRGKPGDEDQPIMRLVRD